ncbi:MAG: hypothetical protein ISR51_01700 [Rhodospirillales bacterium]|nr:hypothetical protein [Alphaproteobacteria bacterium]MBL6947365.1 hypothetical protein [Rhodospirillales bacterium]
MAVKPEADNLTIKEQIIEDPVSGLSLQFSVVEGSDSPFRLRVFGALPHGNREFVFDTAGIRTGAGSAVGSFCRPTWLTEVS